jgi:hypothetical protein
MAKTQTPDALAAEFGPRVQSIGRILPMLEPWRQPEYLTRAWCLFELDTAIRHNVAIDIILTPEMHLDFVSAMATEGYPCIDTALSSLKSATATASRDADLAAIQALILSKPGGFITLDRTVQQHLHEWFESQGAVRSGDRINRVKSSQPREAGLASFESVQSADIFTKSDSGVFAFKGNLGF